MEGIIGGILLVLLFGLVVFCFWHRILIQMLASRNVAASPEAILHRGDSQESREVRRHVALWRSFLDPTPDTHGPGGGGITAPPASANPSPRASWVPYTHSPKHRQPMMERTLSSRTSRRPDVTVLPMAMTHTSYRVIPPSPMPAALMRDITSTRRMGMVFSHVSTDEGYESGSPLQISRWQPSSWRTSSWSSRVYNRVSSLLFWHMLPR